jgi:hypothetical protein
MFISNLLGKPNNTLYGFPDNPTSGVSNPARINYINITTSYVATPRFKKRGRFPLKAVRYLL